MESPYCPACQAAVPSDAAACPRCGAALATSEAAQPAKKRFPTWAWVVLGVGCGCPSAIVVLGLLATLIIPNLLPKFDQDGVSARTARMDITSIVNALNEYAIRNMGRYPDSLEVLVIPDENGYRFLTSKRVPRDPWKQEYHYEPPTPDSSDPDPHVWSNGTDGVPGGGDDIDSRTMNR
ncbi:MAG: type II secretion system protein GspG [Planctomycetes bacterium]|nr:type II secretion system protein GspG [Planctomycetota bacterium]